MMIPGDIYRLVKGRIHSIHSASKHIYELGLLTTANLARRLGLAINAAAFVMKVASFSPSLIHRSLIIQKGSVCLPPQ